MLVVLGLVALGCGSSTSSTTEAAGAGAVEEVATATTPPEPTPAAEATPTPAPTPEPSAEPDPTEVPATESDDPGPSARSDLEAELQRALDEWAAHSTAPGVSLSVLLPGEEPINLATGVSDLATGSPTSVDDYFRIASITKPVTAALVLQLAEEGLVDIEAPVTTYLGPDWLGAHPNAADITVAQLMNHTNGLIEYAFDIKFYVEAAARLDTPYEPEEILEFLSRQEPLFEPGAAYQYETGGFVAAGLIVEAVTGNSAAAEMRGRLFEPAGAGAIFLTPEEFPPVDVVHGYNRGDLYGAFRLLLPELDTGLEVGDADPVIDIFAGNQAVLQSAGWTGGGLEAQMESVARVFRAMFDGTLLSPESIKSMTDTVFDSGYGLGLSVGETEGELVYSHGGGVPGFRSHAAYLPDHDIALAMSSNLIPLPDDADISALADKIVGLLLAAD